MPETSERVIIKKYLVVFQGDFTITPGWGFRGALDQHKEATVTAGRTGKACYRHLAKSDHDPGVVTPRQLLQRPAQDIQLSAAILLQNQAVAGQTKAQCCFPEKTIGQGIGKQIGTCQFAVTLNHGGKVVQIGLQTTASG